MRQWGLKQKLPKDTTLGANGFTTVKLIPDGAALITRGMGVSCVWEQRRGFGERSWCYSMVVKDMTIEKLFIEGGGIAQVRFRIHSKFWMLLPWSIIWGDPNKKQHHQLEVLPGSTAVVVIDPYEVTKRLEE